MPSCPPALNSRMTEWNCRSRRIASSAHKKAAENAGIAFSAAVAICVRLSLGQPRIAQQFEVIERDRHDFVVVRRLSKHRTIVGLQVVEQVFLLLLGV